MTLLGNAHFPEAGLMTKPSWQVQLPSRSQWPHSELTNRLSLQVWSAPNWHAPLGAPAVVPPAADLPLVAPPLGEARFVVRKGESGRRVPNCRAVDDGGVLRW